MDQATLKAVIMDEQTMDRVITRVAHEIIEHNEGAEGIALVGVLRRGVPIAERLADKIEAIEGIRPKIGKLDISFYRDDYYNEFSEIPGVTNVMIRKNRNGPTGQVDLKFEKSQQKFYELEKSTNGEREYVEEY